MNVHPKVGAAAVAAAITTLLVAALGRLGVDLSDAEQGAVTTLLVFAAGWLKG